MSVVIPVTDAGMLTRGVKTCVRFPMAGTGTKATGAQINIPGASQYLFTTAFSIAFWWSPTFNPSFGTNITGTMFSYQHNVASSSVIVIKNTGGTTNGGYRINVSNSIGTAGNFNNTSATLRKNLWYRTVLTYDGTTAKLYTNGATDGSAALASPALFLASDPIQFGNITSGFSSGGTPYIGRMAQVKVYNITLTASDAVQDFLAGKTSQESGLVGWWKLSDGRGNKALDSSGNNNVGSLLQNARYEQIFRNKAMITN